MNGIKRIFTFPTLQEKTLECLLLLNIHEWTLQFAQTLLVVINLIYIKENKEKIVIFLSNLLQTNMEKKHIRK